MMSVRCHQAAVTATISTSEQRRAVGKSGTSERRSLYRDRANRVHIPLDLNAEHAAVVVVLIQPLRRPDWPDCTIFAAAIEATHCCCRREPVLRLITEKVDQVILHFYPQVTIDVPTALRRSQFHQLGQSW